MTGLVPNRLLLDVEVTIAYRGKPPRVDGSLDGWSDAELLPPLCRLDGVEPFAPVWCCWNEAGLYVACCVEGKRSKLKCDPSVFWKSDNLRLCTDMRDARANRRATRYCQQFFILPTGGGRNGDEPVAGSTKIHRAREDAPLFASETLLQSPGRKATRGSEQPRVDDAGPRIQVAAMQFSGGYQLEAHVPVACLHGFDPAEHDRIGLYYILEDRDLGQQYLTVGDDLNWHIDPSTWATAVLARG